MFSFLNIIDKYIKDNRIPFKRIEFSYALLPEYINQAILNEMRGVVDNHFELGTETYELVYDNNDKLCLLVHDALGRREMVFSNYESGDFVDLDFKHFSRSEKNLIIKACVLKHLQTERLKIRDIIKTMAPEISLINRVKLEYKLLEEEVNKIINDKEKLAEIVDNTNYEDALKVSVDKIIDYIGYLFELYNDTEMQGVKYMESDGDNIPRGPKVFSGAKERVNEVIPAEDRINVLDSYPYVFKEYAYTSTNDEITYMNYLYMLDDNLYALVLEPINGTKYTKIVIFDDTHEISRDEFKDYIKYYLELTELEFLDESNVVRSGHTSLDTFKDKMDLVVLGSSNLVSNSYFKKRVKDLKEQ